MKCSVCGKEFGEGMTCQNCGVDRVTGLGNYSGYETPNGNATSRSSSGSQNGSYRQEVVSQPKIVEVKSIVCYNCGEIIPRYCSTVSYKTHYIIYELFTESFLFQTMNEAWYQTIRLYILLFI